MPGPGGHHWEISTIKRILLNRVYRGATPYRKRIVQRDRRGRSHSQTLDGEWIEGTHPPLVTEAVWAAVQSRYHIKRQLGPRSQDSPYWLSGLIRCGVCGGAMGISHDHYVCTRQIRTGTCTREHRTPRRQVEETLLARLEAFRDLPAEYWPRDVLVSLSAEDPQAMAWYTDWVERDIRRQALQAQLERLSRAWIAGHLEERLYHQLHAEVLHGLAAVPSADTPPPPAVIRAAQDNLQRLIRRLRDPATPMADRRSMIQQVVAQITINRDRTMTVHWREPHPHREPAIRGDTPPPLEGIPQTSRLA